MKMDLENLFINNPVQHVQEFLQKRRSEVERKKDELRSLVGERHRDVIEASDTIQAMKDLSSMIANATQTLDNLCTQLTASLPVEYDSTPSKYLTEFSVATHVKFLLDIPEMIWNNMDSGDHLSAAILFFVGRQVSARLQLSSELASSGVDVHVLVKRLWNSLAHMEVAVLCACRRRLSAAPSTAQELCNSLVALMLLENGSLEQALNEYLNCRKSALQQILGDSPSEVQSNADQNATVPLSLKKQLALLGKFLLSTLGTTEYLFKNDGGDSVSAEEPNGAVKRTYLDLKKWKLKDSPWLVGDRLYTHLPQDVLNYQLFSQVDSSAGEGFLTDLPISLIQQRVCDWWSESIASCHSTVTKSMSYVSSLTSLVAIRASVLHLISAWNKSLCSRAASAFERCSNTVANRNSSVGDSHLIHSVSEGSHVGRSLLQRRVDLWDELFAEPFLVRITQLVENIVDEALCRWTLDVESLVSHYSQKSSSNSTDKTAKTDNIDELSNFVWSDVIPDFLLTESLDQFTTDTSFRVDEFKQGSNIGVKSERPAAFTSLTRILREDNVGLVVFCYLTNRFIPTDIRVPPDKSEVSFTPPPHLLVLLQRLVFGGSTSPTIDLPLPSPTTANRRHTDTNPLTQRLSLLSPTLQNICRVLDETIAEMVLTVTQSAHRDWLRIWKLLINTLERLVYRCKEWLLTSSYGQAEIHEDSLSSLQVNPGHGLLLARACRALISLCPSIGATIVAATGVIESAAEVTASRNADDSGGREPNAAAKRAFSWSDLPHLRSVWSATCAPVFDTVDRLTVDCLCNAIMEKSVFEVFLQRMLSSIPSVTPSTALEETELSECHSILHEIVEYGELDCLSDLVAPFENIRLESNSSEADVDDTAMAILHIPSSISLPLHQLLLVTVRTIGQLLVHKVPEPPLNQEICLRICQSLLNVYEKLKQRFPPIAIHKTASDASSSDLLENGNGVLAETPLPPTIQPIALQLIFDIRYLVQLLVWPVFHVGLSQPRVTGENVRTKELSAHIKQKSTELLSDLEAYVDPFDWEMCNKRLSVSVSRTLTITSHLYAPLVCPKWSGSEDTSQVSVDKNRNTGSECASLMPLVPVEVAKDKTQAPTGFATLQLSLPSWVDKRRSKLGPHLPTKAMQQIPPVNKSIDDRSVINQPAVEDLSNIPVTANSANSFIQLGSRWFLN